MSDDHDGRALAQVVKRCGYLDAKGQWVIDPKYYWARDFSNGLAEVKINEWGTKYDLYIDPAGKTVWKQKQEAPATLPNPAAAKP